MIALTCAVALAALPAFVAKVPKANLPYTVDKANHPLGPKLSAAEAKPLYAGVPELGKRYETWKKAPDETKLELYAGAVVPWPGATWLLMYTHFELQMGTSDEAWLVALDAKGAVTDAARVADWSNSEVGETLEEISLTASGTVERTRTTKPALQDLGAEDEMLVMSSSTSQLKNGKLELGKLAYTNNEGRFVDEKSKEQLSFVHSGKVYYQGSVDKPVQELTVEGDPNALELVVRFKNARRPYALTFDKTRESIKCAPPTGPAQTFKRNDWSR